MSRYPIRSRKPAIFESLPEELQIRILKHLEPKLLARAALVSIHFCRISEDESLWLKHCKRLWKDKQFYALDEAKIARHQSELEQGGKIWKEKYVFSLRDSRRTRITKEELSSIRWEFKFHFSRGPTQACKFKIDGTFEMEEGDDDGPWQWRFTPQHKIQVNQYPHLSISRRMEDWAWLLQNAYVELYSNDDSPAFVPPLALKKTQRPVLLRVGQGGYIVMGNVNDNGEVEVDEEILNAMDVEDIEVLDEQEADNLFDDEFDFEEDLGEEGDEDQDNEEEDSGEESEGEDEEEQGSIDAFYDMMDSEDTGA